MVPEQSPRKFTLGLWGDDVTLVPTNPGSRAYLPDPYR